MRLVATLCPLLVLLCSATETWAETNSVPPAPQPAPPGVQTPAQPLRVPPPIYQPVYWYPPPAYADRPPAGERGSRWYGWQTLTVDAAGITLGALLLANQDTTGLGATVLFGGYLLGAPIVHAARGNWGRAAASFGTRVGAPFVGGALAVALLDCSGDDDLCDLGYAVAGAFIGATAAIALDAAVYSREPRPETDAAPRLALTPALLPSTARRAPALGAALHGTF